MFPGYNIDSAEETVLGGNQFKSDSNRLLWKSSGNKNGLDKNNLYEEPLAIPAIQLNPMEIRTFIIRLSKI